MRAAEDAATETPTHLTLSEQVLEASGIAVALPARPRTAAGLRMPPRPTVPASRQRRPDDDNTDSTDGSTEDSGAARRAAVKSGKRPAESAGTDDEDDEDDAQEHGDDDAQKRGDDDDDDENSTAGSNVDRHDDEDEHDEEDEEDGDGDGNGDEHGNADEHGDEHGNMDEDGDEHGESDDGNAVGQAAAGAKPTAIAGAKPTAPTAVAGAKPAATTAVTGAKPAATTAVTGAKPAATAAVAGVGKPAATAAAGAKPAATAAVAGIGKPAATAAVSKPTATAVAGVKPASVAGVKPAAAAAGVGKPAATAVAGVKPAPATAGVGKPAATSAAVSKLTAAASDEEGSFSLQGASRITGGIFRGRAAGNAPNMADFGSTKTSDNLGYVRGMLFMYTSPSSVGALDIAITKVDFQIRCEVTEDVMELVTEILKRDSSLEGKPIYFHEEGYWILRGRVGEELTDKAPVKWVTESGNYMLRVFVPESFGLAASTVPSSRSVSGSGSRAGSSVPSVSDSYHNSPNPSDHEEILTALGVDLTLAKSSDGARSMADYTIFIYYEKWKAIDQAHSTYQNLKNQQSWPFQNLSPYCQNSNFTGMLAWLDSNGTLPSEEIWHVEKAVYTINDLKAWVDNGGTLDPKSKRAKEKGKGKEKQKGISHKKGSTSRKQ
ncbi:hypothetical protein BDZ97DRAFT_1930684 [Flammula alnicola]|nr:hypothetical protein BDZ97DRAFT_1930684 [Flammula alnicola]